MYVTLDATIKQIVDIMSSLLPTSFLIFAGYMNNGGCSCGCSTHCSRPYERWHCQGDIGYACSDSIASSNTPFYGSPNRIAPCTQQNQWTYASIHFFSLGIIVLSYMYFIRLCLQYPITPELRDEIDAAVKKRENDEDVIDPLTKSLINSKVHLDQHDQRILDAVKHHTREELEELVGEDPNLLENDHHTTEALEALHKKMREKLAVRAVACISLILVLVFSWALRVRLHAALQALMVIAVVLLIMTSTLNVMRQCNLMRQRDALVHFINFVRFDMAMRRENQEDAHLAQTWSIAD